MFYKDYFSIREEYAPCMNWKAINRNKETWLEFYPHKDFVKFLRSVLESLDGGNQSVWLTGAYGTGKSHVVLVLQKLFMDDDSRVEKFLERRKELIPSDLINAIHKWRNEKVLTVFDSNTTGINTPGEFLVRMERSILDTLKDGNYKLPVMGTTDSIIDRIRQDGKYFFDERNNMQDRLAYLTPDITNWEQLAQKLKEPAENSAPLFSDVMSVLHAREIYPNLSAGNLIQWSERVLSENGFSKLLFIWDEFSTYVEKHAGELKTFEDIAEAAQEGKFFFIPVTHMEMKSYMAAGSESAKKTNNRFKFLHLDMPTNTALLLAADAFTFKDKAEWEKEQAPLWQSVRGLVENYMLPKGCEGAQAEDFKKILPIHPMAAFVLRYLSSAVGANQRSMFNYLKGEDGKNQSEFQKFIAEGGPEVETKQFLTVDYLWRYFIERDDLGYDNKAKETRIEYIRKSKNLNESEQRVYKAVLLYSLLGRLYTDGHDLLQPTIENIVRSFEGDGSLFGVESIIRTLEKKHCFSIVGNRCEMFHVGVEGEELQKEIQRALTMFHELILSNKTQPRLESKFKAFLKVKSRCDVRVMSFDKCVSSSIKNKDLYGPDGNRVLVLFVLACTQEDQLQIPDKVKTLAENFKDRRIVYFTMPNLTFCKDDANRWLEYAEQTARKGLTTDNGAKSLHSKQLENMEKEWNEQVTDPLETIRCCKPNPNGSPYVESLNWGQLESYLHGFIKETIGCFVDDFSGYNGNAMGAPTSLQSWAKAGLLDSASVPNRCKTTLGHFEKMGIRKDANWFTDNPNHPLTQIRDYCRKRLDSALKNGECSIRKIYIDLQKAPYGGLLCLPYSALVLGFVLRECLSDPRQLQWTDGICTMKLDADTLAEIIEDVVKDDGKNAIKNEKKICRLSKEEKAFIKQSIAIFSLHSSSDGTVERTLSDIAESIRKTSGRVPLWVLKDYIQTQNEPNGEDLCTIIDLLCAANTMSNKNDTEKRTNHVKQIGDILQKTEGLAEVLKKYICPDCFTDAFRLYVDKKKPVLKELAAQIHDSLDQFYQAVKDRFSSEAGWLWTPLSVDDELDKIEAQYKIIGMVQYLTGNAAFMRFDDAIERIVRAMTVENKISLSLIAGNYPALTRFREVLKSVKIGDTIHELVEILEQQKSVLKTLFFDPACSEQIEILLALFQDQLKSLNTSELKKLYGTLDSGALLPEEDFKKHALLKIETFLKDSISSQVLSVWREKTGSLSPDDWSNQTGFPVEILFQDSQKAKDIIGVVTSPSNYDPEVLKRILQNLQEHTTLLEITSPQELSERFLKRALPVRYQKLKMDAKELSDVLKNSSLGQNPNRWFGQQGFLATIEAFISERYDSQYKPQAVQRVGNFTEAEAKEQLLKLVEFLPDAGLRILEDRNDNQ